MTTKSVAVIGGGIVGLAVARALALERPSVAVTVFEKEDRLAGHQSGHNSGVIHAGLYYQPGSLKARLCRRGGSLLRTFCADHAIDYQELGKIVVATRTSELPALDDIERRAVQNQVPGIRRLGRKGITEREPHVTGLAAVLSPTTAVVDYVAVCEAMALDVISAGGSVQLRQQVRRVSPAGDKVELELAAAIVGFDAVIVCAGLGVDALARSAHLPEQMRIIPFRGEYYELTEAAAGYVRGLVYPVPDPRYPFLGVHLTRSVDGHVHVGPNAVLALALEGYRRRDIALADVGQIASWPGFWRMAAEHYRAGIKEMAGSLSKRLYLRQLRRYVPELRSRDLVRSPAGVRAQAIRRDGRLVDDFAIQTAGRIAVVRNAPSPAATSSLAIAEHLLESWDLVS